MVALVSKVDEGKIRTALFGELCKTHPDDVVVLEWKGTWEQRKGSKAQFKPFDRTFDVARFHRVMDKSASPILYAYVVDATPLKRTGSGPPQRLLAEFKGLHQIRPHLDQDADCSFMVTVPLENHSDDNRLIEAVKEKNCFGLVYVEESGGKLAFREMRDPSGRNKWANVDRKKIKLTAISLNENGCKDIQGQEWARKAEYLHG